ncbi:YkvA family protein [Paenibacillus hamazuiensis]|uniref:YkvA family protein n=1 Tax=Paenibacillus hamazuiensis TaxID=2936508 RepID=UPI00200F2C92|nr:YkvA family protein [Paenibacillus hamazuiensis]
MKRQTALDKLKSKARSIKQNIYVLYLAYKDPRVPRYAKLFAVCVVAYAFSPIDLIPDFIPVLGYLDDLIIVPLGISLALKMIPEPVLADCRVKAEELRKNGKPKNWFTGALFIAVWILAALWIGKLLYGWLKR